MAIWEKLFSKITFKNYPDTSTPVNADNLNKMSDAIDGIDDRVVELNSNLTDYIMIRETMENCSFPKNVRTVLTPTKPNVEGYNIHLINARAIIDADLNNMGVNNNNVAFFNPVSNDYSCDVYFVWLLIKKLN